MLTNQNFRKEISLKILTLVFVGFAVLILLLDGCQCRKPIDDKPLDEDGNQPPVIASFAVDKAAIELGQTAVLTVTATDPEGGELNYRYTLTGGGNVSGSGSVATYSAPMAEGTPLIKVTVSDEAGKQAEKSLNLMVSANPFDIDKDGVRGYPYGIDFDGDGDGQLHVIVGGRDPDDTNPGYITNTGDGTFQAKVSYPGAAGASPGGIIVVDINNDGNLDAVHSGGGGNNVGVLLGDGAGTLGAANGYSVSTTCRKVICGDINKDGKIDVIASSKDYLEGNGDGTLQAAVITPIGYSFQLVLNDFNADGNFDLVGSVWSGTAIKVALGNGDGTFAPKTDYTAPAEPMGLGSVDFNGDGTFDLATSNGSNNSISVFLSQGNGSFNPAATMAGSVDAECLIIADYDNDGKADIVTANYSTGNISFMKGNGDGTFQAEVTNAGVSYPVSIATADFNGDGNMDLVIGNLMSALVGVCLGNGDGTFQGPVNYNTNGGPRGVCVGDMNKDGKLDLIVSSADSNTVDVLLSN